MMHHHTQEEKFRAIELYIKTNHSAAMVKQTLGYPDRSTLSRWYNDYLKIGYVRGPHKWQGKYSETQKQKAVQYYLDHGKNQSLTTRELGYPSCSLLGKWIDEIAPYKRKTIKPHGKKRNVLDKIRIVEQIVHSDTTIEQASNLCDIDKATFYNWRNALLEKGAQQVVEKIKDNDLSSSKDELKQEINKLQKELQYYKMEVAIWQGASKLLKKDPSVNLESLSNKEKTILIDALRTTFSLGVLLDYFMLSKSSFYYSLQALRQKDKYDNARKAIIEEFESVNKSRGYRYITKCLRVREDPIIISEKIVRRIMKEEGLHVPYSNKKKRTWSSYQGELSAAPQNHVKRHFHADAPNKLWLTDITQFALNEYKCYLSVIIDCFDGMVASYKISRHPNACLANATLDDATTKLNTKDMPICHSDRGAHYRWPGWIKRCESAGITRSMSKKGCSPDNAACEGFFGRLKNEFYYNRDWKNTSYASFKNSLTRYIKYYNEERLKQSLGWKSPIQYRRSLDLVA